MSVQGSAACYVSYSNEARIADHNRVCSRAPAASTIRNYLVLLRRIFVKSITRTTPLFIALWGVAMSKDDNYKFVHG